ncbi:hypothetical protein FOA52_000543 [Chlamydomonas sp. UWO 241]|nr:hypothetical protein FOA52_000543 [Chlamydomonas sp. UWO 241]
MAAGPRALLDVRPLIPIRSLGPYTANLCAWQGETHESQFDVATDVPYMNKVMEYADGDGPADAYPIPAHDKHARVITLIYMKQPQQDAYTPRFKTAIAMWRGLLAAHTKKSLSNRSASLQNLAEVRQLPREGVELYINRVMVLRVRVMDVGIKIDENLLLEYILAGLHSDYNFVKIMISHGGAGGIGFDLDTATAILLDAETKISKPVGSVSFVSSSNFGFKPSSGLYCYGCKEPGHMFRECPNKHKWNDATRQRFSMALKHKSSDDKSSAPKPPGFACMVAASFAPGLDPPRDPKTWLIDSACTSHLAYGEEVVDNYVPVTRPTFMSTADTSSRGLEIKGYGDLTIVTIVNEAPRSVKLVNVHVAPTLRANPISSKLFNKVGATLIAAPECANFAFRSSVIVHTTDQSHGLWAVTNLHSGKYISTITDDFSRLCHVDILKSKSDAPAAVMKCLNNWMTYTGNKVKAFRSALQAWGEATRACNYMRNRAYSSVLGDTPYRLFTGEEPDLSKIRVFGSLTWVYGFPKNKLAPRAIKGVFVDYEPGTPAYRIYHPESGKITVKREVRIIEGDRAATSISYRGFFEEEDGERCLVCHSPDSAYPSVMLLCDGCKPDGTPCSNAYHLSCKPALDSVPEGDWFCPGCTKNEDNRMPDLVNASDSDSDDDDPAQKQSSGGQAVVQQPAASSSPSPSPPSSPPSPAPPVQPVPSPPGSSPPSPMHALAPQAAKTTRSGKSYGSQLSGVVSFIAKNDPDPISLKEAQSREDWPLWEEAIHEEYASHVEKLTWNKARIPSGQRLLPVKWVFKRKYDERGNLERYKARLVVQGFRQIPGIDFAEVFAPVSKYTTLRCLIAFAADHDLEIHQIDVRNAFLNGRLKENIWIEQPPLFHDGDSAPKVWYEEILSSLTNLGFVTSVADPCLFIRPAKSRSDYVYLLLYVDDMLVIGRTSSVREVVGQVTKAYECRDLGCAKQFLGMAITRDRGSRTILLTQAELTKQLLLKFNLSECRTRDVPSTPDITYAVSKLSSQGLRRCRLSWLRRHRRSTTGFVVTYNGTAVSWKSTTQQTVSRSTTEAEYQACGAVIGEAQWMIQLFPELGIPLRPMLIYSDSQGALVVLKNLGGSSRSKHIDVLHHVARERVMRKDVLMEYFSTSSLTSGTARMVADILTKALPKVKFEWCRKHMGMI